MKTQKTENPFAQFGPISSPRSLDDELNPFVQFGPSLLIQSDTNSAKPNEFLQEAGRQVGLTGRAAGRAAGDLAGFVGDPLNAAINKIVGTHLSAVSQSAQSYIDKLFPNPKNATERVVGDAASMMASLGGGSGLTRGLSALFRGTNIAKAQPILQQLGQLSKTDLASAATSGAGASFAHENEMGVGGQLLGGLLGASALPAAKAAFALPKIIPARLAQAIPEETLKLGKRANELGIPLRAAQLSHSRSLQVIDSVLSKLPLSGAGAIQEAQQQGFNQAVSRTFGENAARVNATTMDAAKKRLGSEFNRIAGQNKLQVDQQLFADLAEIEGRAKFLEPGQAQVINRHIDDILEKSPNGWMAGEAYQNKRSYLSKQKSAGAFGHELSEIRAALDNAFQRSVHGEDAFALKGARAQWRNMRTVENLAEKAPDGNLSPALLMGEVRRAYPNFAYSGAGDIGDLARIGQQFLKDKVQNSGTPERAAVLGMLGGGIAGIPASVAGLLAGRATGSVLNSPKLANQILAQALIKGVGLPQNTSMMLNPLTWTLAPYLASTHQQSNK